MEDMKVELFKHFWNIDALALNRVDKAWAQVSEEMLIKYKNALSDVHND